MGLVCGGSAKSSGFGSGVLCKQCSSFIDFIDALLNRVELVECIC